MAEGERKGLAEGERKGLVEGERRALLTLLESRGLSVTTEERATIDACSEPAKLDQWVIKAVSARSVSEVLAMNGKRPARRRAARPK